MNLRPAILAARATFAPAGRAFHAKLAHPGDAQSELLTELAARAARTAYGRHHRVSTALDFRSRLPVVTWDDLAPWLERQRASEDRVVTDGRVRFYEKTSGSSGAAKLVPYTSALLRSFTRMFVLWTHDLLAFGPRFRTGQLYFSVSPSFAERAPTERGVRVGLDDDADYLGPWLKPLLRPFVVAPSGASRTRDPETWKHLVASHLVRAKGLEIVSVWNPSMLKVLLDWITEHRAEMARDLRRAGDHLRAELLERTPIPWTRLWPELKLVSCWASAGAKPLAEALGLLLPGVFVQGKGLLATEAPMTIPSIRAGGYVPLVDEVFFELEETPGERLRLLSECDVGGTYGLVVSQKGGLLRYRIGDRVRVTHRYRSTPCLEFLGRDGSTSDLVGEKLHEDFVRSALDAVDLGGAFFRSLFPRRRPHDHYVLVVDETRRDPDELARDVDRALSAAHHYGHARALGQLAPVRTLVVPNAGHRILELGARRGLRWGDSKHRLLVTTPADDELEELGHASSVDPARARRAFSG